MLLRQLPRHIPQSVAPAWRPKSTPKLCGSASFRTDSHLQLPTYQPSSKAKDTESKTSTTSRLQSEKTRLNTQPSLFDHLFPGGAEEQQTGEDNAEVLDEDGRVSRLARARDDDREPPRLSLEGLTGEEEAHLARQLDLLEARDSHPPTLRRAKSVLVLRCASKSLLESDFVRISRQGKHIAGWKGDILKDTLHPLGDYYILFESRAAAIAYKSEVHRLWEMCKEHVPDGGAKKAMLRRQPVPPGLPSGKPGEDVAAALKSFTLINPSQRYRLEPVQSSTVGGRSDVVNEIMTRVALSRFLVLVTFAGGERVSTSALRAAIEDDGRDRNLPWRVTDLASGILPFGVSGFPHRRRLEVDNGGGSFEPDYEDQRYQDSGRGSSRDGERGDVVMSAADEREFRQYPRFIVAFRDNAEAHRFVREWHRRELGLGPGPLGNSSPIPEVTRIVNASILC